MLWTETTRKHYERQFAWYSGDMTDDAWAVIAPLLPGRNQLGRRCKVELRKVDLRDVWDAIQYIVASGYVSRFDRSRDAATKA